MTDANGIFEDQDINAVFICSPTDTHIDMIKRAAQAKKHIFCEKPISFSDEETMEAYKVVKENGVTVQIGFNRRFDKQFAAVAKQVQNGAIGDLHILKITSRDPAPPPVEYIERSGGMFMDMTIHDFDMARFLSGSEVEEVHAYGTSIVNPAIGQAGDVDTGIITLKFANGALGVIDNSREAKYGYDQRAEVFGSFGMAESKNVTESTVITSTASGVVSDKPLHFFLERYEEAYKVEVEAFFEAIKEGKESPCPFEAGIMAQRIAMAAKESVEKGMAVKVKQLG